MKINVNIQNFVKFLIQIVSFSLFLFIYIIIARLAWKGEFSFSYEGIAHISKNLRFQIFFGLLMLGFYTRMYRSRPYVMFLFWSFLFTIYVCFSLNFIIKYGTTRRAYIDSFTFFFGIFKVSHIWSEFEKLAYIEKVTFILRQQEQLLPAAFLVNLLDLPTMRMIEAVITNFIVYTELTSNTSNISWSEPSWTFFSPKTGFFFFSNS